MQNTDSADADAEITRLDLVIMRWFFVTGTLFTAELLAAVIYAALWLCGVVGWPFN